MNHMGKYYSDNKIGMCDVQKISRNALKMEQNKSQWKMDLFNNFNKKHSFKNDNCVLPAAEYFFQEGIPVENYEPLQTIKRILNFVKSKLNNYKIEEWGEHTKRRNPAQQIVYHLKNSIKAEFVTQAFAKFFECINSYPMIDDNLGDKFFSVHLCEAPGAFITSLNHYLKLHHPQTKFEWIATTLNPYYEGNSIGNTILDDRLILHTLPNWFFGETHSGDIINPDNIRSLVSYCKSIGNVQLVTCDGSIDCLDKPEYQEEHVSKLHIAEFITSIALLADNGTMLIKIFTFFEVSTVSMLYVLNCCFKSVHLFKPATSKEGNSEVYVIALNFKKNSLSDAHIDRMIDNFTADDRSMLPLSQIPQDFLNQVTNAARFFMNQQVAVIENNIRTFKKYDKREYERIKSIKYLMVEEYMKLYHMKPIDEHKKLLHGAQLNTDLNLNERVHRGSHLERISFRLLDKSDQLTVLYDRLKGFYDYLPNHVFLSNNNPISFKSNDDPKSFIKIIRGKPIEKVVSSKFIIASIFKYFSELRTFLEELPVYEGTCEDNFIINGNHITVEKEYFKQAVNYDAYEKDVTTTILNHILEHKSDELIVDGLPLLTQFLVGVILYLGLFVYDKIYLNRSDDHVQFISLRVDGIDNLKYLLDVINQNRSNGIIGICDTKSLFTCNNVFYKSVIDYNNQNCIRLCSFYLNNISN
ncbi:cap-specific mRNA (nucleoside-2'-O-)-methyltransferase 2 [Chironomus tepperi]|uniref:cap-specific mRNA (nucleoside-2'-O-)-methyltransferase 2 n=1 Tax=Chironomus tepperi TaxID=113505 RepID=UPI00391F835B